MALTKDEALIEMYKGNKVTNDNMSANDYLYVSMGVIYTDNGIDFDNIGWAYMWDTGWHIYNDTTSNTNN